MNRIAALIDRLGWTHLGLASFLGVAQPTVTRYVATGSAPGASGKLLDALEAAVVAGEIEPGVPPEGALIVVTARAQGFDAGGASSPSSGVAAGVGHGHA